MSDHDGDTARSIFKAGCNPATMEKEPIMATVTYTVENVIDDAHSNAIVDAINDLAYVSGIAVVTT